MSLVWQSVRLAFPWEGKVARRAGWGRFL